MRSLNSLEQALQEQRVNKHAALLVLEKTIKKLHGEGLSYVDIAARVNRTPVFVRKVIKREYKWQT